MPVKCIKCGVSSGRIRGVDPDTYVCDDCKQHQKVIMSLYKMAENTFKDSSVHLEKTEIYELLKQIYFIVQKNPKLSVYMTIVKELLEAFATKNMQELDYDELWRRTKSTRNIWKIIKSMEDAGIIKIESPDRIRRILKPGPVLKNFSMVYSTYKTKEHAKTRVSSVLAMYAILHELYQIARAKNREEIENYFGPHPPKAPWVATMFLWTKRIASGGVERKFTVDEIRRYFAKRGLSSTTISNYIAALKATNPQSVQQYIENIEPDGGNGLTFVVREDIIRTLERIYGGRVRESDRD